MAENNQKNIGEKEFDEELKYELPIQIRWTISIPIILLILAVLSIYVYFIFCNPSYIDPEKYGLPTVLVVSVIILIVINISGISLASE